MRKIAVIDCETDPFVYGRVPKPFLWAYYDGTEFLTFGSTDALLAYIKDKREYIYAHNGGKFDFHYLLPHVKNHSSALIINGRVVQFKLGRAILRDSYAILPIPLADYQKDTIDYAKFEANVRNQYMNEIIDYLHGDCVYLYQLVTAFINEFGNRVTLAQAAFKRARQLDGIATFQTNSLFYNIFKPYYHGGRVSIFHHGIVSGKTYIYDINSAYPFAMIHKHPFGNTVNIKNAHFTIDTNSFYVVECDSFGAYPLLEKRQLSYPDDGARRIFHVTGYELDATQQEFHNANGIIRKQIRFTDAVSFDAYVAHYYERKRKAAKHSIDYILAKLAMNSVYGKLAANPDRYFDYIICETAKAQKLRGDTGTIVYWNEHFAIIAKPLDESRKRFYNIATGASITGFVRAMLWSTVRRIRNLGWTVYYCDTDSIITDYPYMETSDALGGWKLEQTNDMLYLYAPKVYAARSIDGKWKTASKGVRLTAQQIQSLCNGASVTWKNDAPTFSVGAEPKFIIRRLGNV